jgi:predicted dehydrogenase
VHAVAALGELHIQTLIAHKHGDSAVEGSHVMPASYPFTAGLRVVCERGVLEHRFVAGAADEVDAATISALEVHPAAGEVRRFHEDGDPWAVQIRQFLDCVETGTEPRDGSYAQARAALALALAARRSIASGVPEPV